MLSVLSLLPKRFTIVKGPSHRHKVLCASSVRPKYLTDRRRTLEGSRMVAQGRTKDVETSCMIAKDARDGQNVLNMLKTSAERSPPMLIAQGLLPGGRKVVQWTLNESRGRSMIAMQETFPDVGDTSASLVPLFCVLCAIKVHYHDHRASMQQSRQPLCHHDDSCAFFLHPFNLLCASSTYPQILCSVLNPITESCGPLDPRSSKTFDL